MASIAFFIAAKYQRRRSSEQPESDLPQARSAGPLPQSSGRVIVELSSEDDVSVQSVTVALAK